MTKAITPQLPKTTENHQRLGAFIGKWHAEGSSYADGQQAADPLASAVPWTSDESYEWLPGEFFVLHRWVAMVGDSAFKSTQTIQKSLYVQWGPPNVGGILEPSAAIATAVVAFFMRKSTRGLWLSLSALLALLLAFPVIFFWLVAPANAGFLAATLPNVPPNWAELRSNWEMGHAIRFGLQLTALGALVLSLVLDTGATPGAEA